MSLSVRRYSGKDAEKYIESIARLRIEVFREYPYLYDGSHAYEMDYLRRYLLAADFALVIAFHHDEVIGASTCLPLEEETEEIKKPLTDTGIKASEVLYFGESVLKASYRRKGLGVRFFEEREAYGKELGKKLFYFCAVERPENHPLKPSGYKDLSEFWGNRGYEKTDVRCYLSWQDLDQEEETSKSLIFWKKRI